VLCVYMFDDVKVLKVIVLMFLRFGYDFEELLI